MSARTSHTPGPWHVVSIGTLAFVAQQSDSEGRFALASVSFPNYHPAGLRAARIEQESNAALIAAAPDLLAALRGMVADWERVTGRAIPADHEARAAIAKAGGR